MPCFVSSGTNLNTLSATASFGDVDDGESTIMSLKSAYDMMLRISALDAGPSAYFIPLEFSDLIFSSATTGLNCVSSATRFMRQSALLSARYSLKSSKANSSAILFSVPWLAQLPVSGSSTPTWIVRIASFPASSGCGNCCSGVFTPPGDSLPSSLGGVSEGMFAAGRSTGAGAAHVSILSYDFSQPSL